MLCYSEERETGTADVIYPEWIPSGFDDPLTADFDQFELDVPQLREVLHDSGVSWYMLEKGRLFIRDWCHFRNVKENYIWRLLTINENFIVVHINSTDGGVLVNSFLDDNIAMFLSQEVPWLMGRSLSKEAYENMSYEEVAQLFGIRDSLS